MVSGYLLSWGQTRQLSSLNPTWIWVAYQEEAVSGPIQKHQWLLQWFLFWNGISHKSGVFPSVTVLSNFYQSAFFLFFWKCYFNSSLNIQNKAERLLSIFGITVWFVLLWVKGEISSAQVVLPGISNCLTPSRHLFCQFWSYSASSVNDWQFVLGRILSIGR